MYFRSVVILTALIASGGMVEAQPTAQLNLGDQIELRALVDLVSKSLDVRILYDETINSKTITIRSPGEIPPESLIDILRSALRMKGFVLIDANADGWMRIVPESNLAAVAKAGDAQDAIQKSGNLAVTQTFILQHADAKQIDEVIKPFLTQPGGNSIANVDRQALIVSDYADRLIRIGQIIRLIDQPRSSQTVDSYAVRHIAAELLAEQLKTMFAARETDEISAEVSITFDERSNQILAVGTSGVVQDVLQTAQLLDVPARTESRIYRLTNVDAEHAALSVERLLANQGDGALSVTPNTADNTLIVSTTIEKHERISRLLREVDLPERANEQNPMRFYKLRHSTAESILETITNLTGRTHYVPHMAPSAIDENNGRYRQIGDLSLPGPNLPPYGASITRNIPLPPGYQDPQLLYFTDPLGQSTVGLSQTETPSLLSQAQVSADIPSNTIIVIAEPSVQKLYKQLIDRLDRHRPQVMIEAKVVVIDTSDDFSLGVEVSGGDRTGGRRLFGFSSFGFSESDPLTGALTLAPGLGLNGVLIDPDVADVVLRALSSHRRARVLSSPKILVNDNENGVLSSVAEVPFTSVNASQTVATTSFAGFAEAGTTITVTPHISERDHLQLDYKITLNSFTGAGSDGIPPGRQTEEIKSVVTIPDGHSIVVGGLNRQNDSSDVTGIPGVERIPVVRNLLTSRLNKSSATTSFIFIRPVILRDDQFQTLKFLSEREINAACIPAEFPASAPVLMK